VHHDRRDLAAGERREVFDDALRGDAFLRYSFGIAGSERESYECCAEERQRDQNGLAQRLPP
jgi:hypothetical protein